MPHTHIHRLVAGLASALLVAAPLALTVTPVSAAPTGLDACAQQNGVYIVVTQADSTGTAVTQDNGATTSPVVTQSGQTTAACVTNPSTGTDALQAAGVTITRDSTGMICALNNYPNPCPATFDGKYWQYYEASASDAAAGSWTYATAGSDDTNPQAGWVEGWCYGAQCVPALPSDNVTPPTPSSTPDTPVAVTNGPGAWITVVGVVVVILVIGTITIVRLRRR